MAGTIRRRGAGGRFVSKGTEQADVYKQIPGLDQQGITGLVHSGGNVQEEFLKELRGRKGMQTYREMKDNDDMVGAALRAIKTAAQGVSWDIEPSQELDDGEQPNDDRIEFIRGALFDDMDVTWGENISEVMSMLWAGWSIFEMVMKRRVGPDRDDPTQKSKFTDGKLGFRKWGIRAQETLFKWTFADDGEVTEFHQQAAPDFKVRTMEMDRMLLFRTEVERGNPEGRSILRNAYTSWFRKKHIATIEGIGIERDLAGYPVFQVKEGGPDVWNSKDAQARALKSNIENIYKNIRRDGQEGLLVPWWLDFTLQSTGGTRQFDTTKIITRYDQRILMTTLTDFIMIGHDAQGSKALSTSKQRLFSNSLTGFLDSITAVVNRHAIPMLLRLNGMPLDDHPVLTHGKVDDTDLSEIAAYIKELSGAGFPMFPAPELEDHLLRIANMPIEERDEARQSMVLDEADRMLGEMRQQVMNEGGQQPMLPGMTQPPKQLTEGDIGKIGTMIQKVVDDRKLTPDFDVPGLVRELGQLNRDGHGDDVAKALDAVCRRLEQLNFQKAIGAPPVTVNVQMNNKTTKKVHRDERGRIERVESEVVDVDPTIDNDA